MGKHRCVLNVCLLSFLLVIVTSQRAASEYQLTAEDFVDSIKSVRKWMEYTKHLMETRVEEALHSLMKTFETKMSMEMYKEKINSMHNRVKQKLESLKIDIEMVEDNMPTPEPLVSTTLNPPTTTPERWVPPWWGTHEPPPAVPDSFGIALDVTMTTPDEGFFFDVNATEKFDNVRLDTDNAYNATSGVYTAPMNGVYLAFLQMDSSDEMPSTFELIKKTEVYWYDPNPYKTVTRVSSDIDHGFAFANLYMSEGNELFVRPASDMGDFTPNVKPGLNTRLSVYCVHQIMPVGWK